MTQQLQIAQPQLIPADAYSFLGAAQVGTPVKEYRNNFGIKLSISLLTMLGGSAFLAISILSLLHAGFNFTAIAALFAGFALVSYGVAQLRMAIHNCGARVYLCTEGVAGVKDGMTDAIRWDAIAQIQKTFTEFTIRGTTSYLLKQYVLLRPDGTSFVLDNSFTGLKEVGKALEQEVTRRFLPGATAVYLSGAPVSFGPLAVSSQGIHLGEHKLLPWLEFKGLKVENGRLTLKKRGSLLAWAVVPTSGMPNMCVFEALVASITGRQ